MTWISQHLLSICLLAPLVAALIMMLVPAERKLAIRLLAAAAGAVTLIVSVTIFFAYDRARAGMQFTERVNWVPGTGISYHLGVDGISVTLVLLTAIIISTGVFASWTVQHRTKEFHIFLLTLVTGVFGVFMSLDLFFFFLFYEVAVLPMYLLIGVWGTAIS
jgi:NADH-quinone oxidoreductase subunit M